MFTFYFSKASLWVDYMTWNRVYSIELSMLAIILLFYKGSLKLVWYACHYSIYAEFSDWSSGGTLDYQSWVSPSSHNFSLNAEFFFILDFLLEDDQV